MLPYLLKHSTDFSENATSTVTLEHNQPDIEQSAHLHRKALVAEVLVRAPMSRILVGGTGWDGTSRPSLVPRSHFFYNRDGLKLGLVHTVCACVPITKNHGNLDISAVFYSVTL